MVSLMDFSVDDGGRRGIAACYVEGGEDEGCSC